MKLKKQLRLSTRVRFANRSRLKGEINDLNTILLKLKSKFLNRGGQKTLKSDNFTDPKSFDVEENQDEPKYDFSSFMDSPKKMMSDCKFFCDRCNFKCRKKGAFDIHSRRHTGDKPFSCDLCEKSFVAKYDLKLHRAKHSNNGNIYHCDSCEYTTYRPDMLVNHMEKHSNIKTLNCEFCDFKSNERTKLSQHKNVVHGIILVCLGCEEMRKLIVDKNETISSGDYIELNNIGKNISHTCGKQWMCNHCGTFFKKQETLLKHKRTHTGERPYKCDRCDYAAAIKNTLTIHKRIHTGQKPYACDQCSFRCTTRSYLKIHLNKHNGIKPFACDQCEYRSVDSCKLIAHKKVRHNEERPFSCQHCPFRAKLKSRLKQHSRTHGLHPFVCPHCAKSFSVRRTLIEHEGIHSGEQPYSCDVCENEKRFTLESTYRMHMSRHFLKYSCNKCDYKTSLKKDLLRHSVVHENESYRPRGKFEKTLQCSFCKFKCAQGMTLYKHVKSNHPNENSDSSIHEVTTDRQNNTNETCDNSSRNNVPRTMTDVSSSTGIYPTIASHFTNPLILNIPPAQIVQIESNGLDSTTFIQSREFSQNCISPIYKNETMFPTVDFNNSVDYKSHQMSIIGHAITNTISSCDQCEYSVADTHKLLIHRRTHLTENHLYNGRVFKSNL